MRTVFYSLQGFGNSIINYPVYAALRERGPVRVVAFENGSADFYRAFADDVIGVRSNGALILTAVAARADESFVCAPTWRREIAAHRLTRAADKRALRPPGPAGWALPRAAPWRPDRHDLENNLDLLGWTGAAPPPLAPAIEVGPGPRRLGLHPTASTELKYYPRTFWKELISILESEFDEISIFCGASLSEVDFARSIAGGREVRAGLDARSLTTAVGNLAAFVGTDSALMHMSAQLGRRTVGLWSYADWRRIHPYGDAAAIYIPRETLYSKTYTRPSTRPAYLDRASAAEVAAVLRGQARADRTLPRRFGPPLSIHEY